MINSNYKKVFSGYFIEAQLIISQLHAIGIEAIVKDEANSARLSGFASSMLGQIDIFVHNDEVSNAETLVNKIIISSKN